MNKKIILWMLTFFILSCVVFADNTTRTETNIYGGYLWYDDHLTLLDWSIACNQDFTATTCDGIPCFVDGTAGTDGIHITGLALANQEFTYCVVIQEPVGGQYTQIAIGETGGTTGCATPYNSWMVMNVAGDDTNLDWTLTDRDRIDADWSANTDYKLCVNWGTTQGRLYVDDVLKITNTWASTKDLSSITELIFRTDGINSEYRNFSMWIGNITQRPEAGAVPTAPEFQNDTWNLTTASANWTAWQDDQTFAISNADITPTSTVDTGSAAYCRCHTEDQNWTTMGNDRNASTTGNISHVCSIAAADALTYGTRYQQIYWACIDSTYTEESTSGSLNISLEIPPTVSIEAPANNTNTTDTTPDIQFNFTDNGYAYSVCTYVINGTVYGTNSSTLNATSTNITSTTLSDGYYRQWVNCSNITEGTSANYTITIDTTNPLLSIQAPANNTVYLETTNVTFSYTANDTNFKNCTLFVNSTINNTNTTEGSSTMITEFSTGVYSWNITCYDNVGNTNSSGTYILTVDTVTAVNLYIEGYNNVTKKWEVLTQPNISVNLTTTFGTSPSIYGCVGIGLRDYGENYSCGIIPFSFDWEIPYVEDNNLYNLTPEPLCFQETANVSTTCGGISTGVYGYLGTIANLNNAWDGDYSSSVILDAGEELYFNYTKPTGSVSADWKVTKGSTSTQTLTITQSCWDGYSDKIVLKATSAAGLVYAWCHNSTAWIQQGSGSANNFFKEESIYWGINETTYSSIDVTDHFYFYLYNTSEVLNASIDISSTDGVKDSSIDIGNTGIYNLIMRGIIVGKSLIESRYNNDNTTKDFEFFGTEIITNFINISEIGDVQRNITLNLTASASNPEGIDYTQYWADDYDWNDTGNETGSAPTFTYDALATSVSGRWNFDTSGGAAASYDITNERVSTVSSAATQCFSGSRTASESAFFNSQDLDMLDSNNRWDFDYYISASASAHGVGFTTGAGYADTRIYLTNSIAGGGQSVLVWRCACHDIVCQYDCPKTNCYGACSNSLSGILSFRKTTLGNLNMYEDDVFKRTIIPPTGTTLEIKAYSYALADCNGVIGSSGSGSSTAYITKILQGGFGANYSDAGDTYTTGEYELISDVILNTSNQSDRSLDIQNVFVNFKELQPTGCDVRLYLRTNYSDSDSWQEFLDDTYTDFTTSGSNLSYRITLNVTSTDGVSACALKDLNLLISTDHPSNATIYLGYSNVPSYQYTSGDLNETNTPIEVSLNYSDVNTYLDSVSCNGLGTCLLPIKIVIASGSEGVLTVDNININQTLDDVYINSSDITTALGECTDSIDTKCSIYNIITGNNGTITLSDLVIRYIGKGNISINVTAYNSTGLTDEQIMIIRYSPFTIAFTNPLIEDVFFNPSSYTFTNQSPYGQYIGRFYNRSILNITSNAIDTIDIYVSTNATDDWWYTNVTGFDNSSYTVSLQGDWDDESGYPATNMYDNNWTTESQCFDDDDVACIMNISFPSTISVWEVSDSYPTKSRQNITVPYYCNGTLFRAVSAYNDDYVSWDCYSTSSTWKTIRYISDTFEIQEQVGWILKNTKLYIMNQTDKNTDVNISITDTRQLFLANQSNSTTSDIYLLLDKVYYSDTPFMDWWNWWESYCSDTGDGYGACVVID